MTPFMWLIKGARLFFFLSFYLAFATGGELGAITAPANRVGGLGDVVFAVEIAARSFVQFTVAVGVDAEADDAKGATGAQVGQADGRAAAFDEFLDRKSTRLNSSHG